MTVVVSINWFNEVLVIADSRVSWQNSLRSPEDILRKLYPIDFQGKSAVLGFCGNILAAQLVMQSLAMDKLHGYKRPFILAQFKDDIRRWIEEAAKAHLKASQRTNLKFMLCGIEPSRHPPIIKNERVVGHIPSFHEAHIYTYSIKKDGTVSSNKHNLYAVIGTGHKIERELVKELYGVMRFGFNKPNLHPARAVLAGETIVQIINKNEDISPTVGGPFQVMRITSEGVEEYCIWPPGAGGRNVEVHYRQSKTFIKNPSTGEEYTLWPIWDFPLHGSTGMG